MRRIRPPDTPLGTGEMPYAPAWAVTPPSQRYDTTRSLSLELLRFLCANGLWICARS